VSEPLIVVDRVTIRRGGRAVFENFSWSLRSGETWAVTGPIGSGKTTFAEVLLAKHFTSAGHIDWPLLKDHPGVYPSQLIRHVAFQENSRLFSYAGHYYQQRFEFADEEEPLSLEQFLLAGGADGESVRAIARQLGIETQLPLSLIKLSNGQTRRARIARALLLKPEVLILDDPFLGVDAAGRGELSELLGKLVRGGLRLVLICPADAVPEWATHRLDLGRAGGVSPLIRSGGIDDAEARGAHAPRSASPIIELRNSTVAHGGKTILRDITWTVRAGERWAVHGPNGSGKTTLLSLLCGDHPQAYANEVRLFGRRRGSGESIWDVKNRIGLLSPEFHLYFHEPLTARRVAATGFFDGVADRPTTPEQDAAVHELLAEFGITHLADRPFRQLSTGEQRLVLLVRALVKRPELLILDEPFQSLDPATMRHARDWLDHRLAPEQTLLFVSHHEDELPRSITHRLELREGHRAR
jgi:molybdate transport system ATP-binding protein